MSISQLLRWQWEGYPRYHRSRANLLLHIVAVPLFIVANVIAVVALVERAWLLAVLAIASMVVAVAFAGSWSSPGANASRAVHEPSQCSVSYIP